MSTSKNYTPTEGYTDLVNPGELGITKLHFGILNLAAEATFFDHSDNTEVTLIALGGQGTLLVGHNGNKAHGHLGERPDVFHGDACVAYIPHHTTYELLAGEAGVEVAVCKTPSHVDTAAVILDAGETVDWANHQLSVMETDRLTERVGEAICLYRFLDEEGTATLQLTHPTQQASRVVLHHNDVLALPESTRARLLTYDSVCYQLWIVCTTPLQSTRHLF